MSHICQHSQIFQKTNFCKTLETFENLSPFSTSLESKIEQRVTKVTSYDEILYIHSEYIYVFLYRGKMSDIRNVLLRCHSCKFLNK